jgi:hypothetical protein
MLYFFTIFFYVNLVSYQLNVWGFDYIEKKNREAWEGLISTFQKRLDSWKGKKFGWMVG